MDRILFSNSDGCIPMAGQTVQNVRFATQKIPIASFLYESLK
jgi:hypothetical protein